MTQLQAVNETIKMWLWLARNPRKEKDAYFEKIEEDGDNIKARCFLCEYINCKGVWGEEFINTYRCPLDKKFLNCFKDNSPFEIWDKTQDDKERTKQAMRIVNACRRWKAKRGKPAKRGR